MHSYVNLGFTDEFLEEFGRLNASERRLVVKALGLLDSDERHPSLSVHALHNELEGRWTAYTSRSLRVVFRRLDSGRKEMVSYSRHYER